MDGPRHGRKFWLVTGLAFALRAAFLLAVGPDPRYALTPDSESYLTPAVALARHGTLSSAAEPPLVPDTRRTPGYPFFLALFSLGGETKVSAASWVQAGLGALTAGLVYILGVLLWGNSFAALAAGLGIAIDFVVIVHTGFILTETVFLFVLTAAFLSLAKAFLQGPSARRWIFLAGLGLSTASLVRPVSLYYYLIAAGLLAWGWWKQKRSGCFAGLALFLAAALLPLMGWMVRNRIQTGAFTFSSSQGLNISVVRAALVKMHLTHKSYDEALAELQNEFRQAHPHGFATASEEISAQTAWSMRFIFSHSEVYLKLLARETVHLLAGNSMKSAAWLLLKDPRHDPFVIRVHPKESTRAQAQSFMSEHPGLGAAMVVYLIFLGAVYSLALAGFTAAWRERGAATAAFALSLAFYIVAVTVGAGAHARYRIPAMPSIFLLAGFGLERIFHKISSKDRRTP
jgi:4-amino-4-deoxy-L-arabinose transferase-like glycosyltransferase